MEGAVPALVTEIPAVAHPKFIASNVLLPSAKAAANFGTFYSMSSMANNTIEEISNISSGPKLFQLYVHKDKSITDDLIDRCKRSNFDGMMIECHPNPKDSYSDAHQAISLEEFEIFLQKNLVRH